MNVRDFIQKLDSFFDREDMTGAGEYLRSSRRDAEAAGDKKLLFTVLNEMMGYYRKTGETERGLEAICSGLKLSAELGLDASPAGATAMLNAATTLKAFGRAEEALPYYDSVAGVYEKAFSPDDYRIAGLCNNHALALADVGRYREAEEKYRRALGILLRNEGRDADVANTYVNMAHLYDRFADYERIESCLDAALAVLDGDTLRNGYYAYTCRKCAPSFGYFGYFAAEKELNERADAIYEGNRVI